MSQVRISDSTHEVLRLLSTQEGKSMQDIIDKAIEDYKRKTFLEGLNADFRALQTNPEALKDYEDEIALWDNTIQDGLDNE